MSAIVLDSILLLDNLTLAFDGGGGAAANKFEVVK